MLTKSAMTVHLHAPFKTVGVAGGGERNISIYIHVPLSNKFVPYLGRVSLVTQLFFLSSNIFMLQELRQIL